MGERRALKRAVAPLALVAAGVLAPASAGADGWSAAPRALTTEHAVSSVFVDVAQPRLSWQNPEDGQSAYEIVVTDGRRPVWDSGRVASAAQSDVPYGGPALASNASYEWAVRVWDEAGRPSGWSRPASFATALLSPSDWTASWLGRTDPAVRLALGQQPPAPLLSKEFTVGRDVASARLHVAGLGYYVAWIDGQRVGDQVLDPGPTQYEKTAVYRGFDVTRMLRRGPNAISVMLGRSYFSQVGADSFGWSVRPDRHEPRLLAQLDITYRDGSTARVASDGSWQMADSPITDDLWYGESYDARREQNGWTQPGFATTGWTPATVQPSPTARLALNIADPVRVTDARRPVAVTAPKTGVRVYDFGGQAAGWARIAVRGAAGTTVTLTYGESLNADGTVFQTAPASHVDTYTLSGRGVETWEPSITRHPLRYVQVAFSPAATKSFSIEARVNHSDAAPAGSFESSNALLNRIEANQRRSLLDNLWGFPSDTPWRDRQGWTADAWLYLDSMVDSFDTQRLWKQWLQSYRDTQRPDGSLPVLVPVPARAAFDGLRNDPSWSGTFVLDAWALYQHYGDRSFIADNYDTAKRWIDLMSTTIAGTGGLYTGFSFGDWASPGAENSPTGDLAAPEGGSLASRGKPLITANGDLYHEARILADMARELAKPADAATYDALAERIKQAFNATFFDPVANTYQTTVPAGYRQTSNLVPLSYGLVPDDHEQAVYDNLVADIHARGDHLNTGAIGTKMLLRVLTGHGDSQLAYTIATQTTYPSWGYWAAQGANTSWETWAHPNAGLSLDHAFLGTITDWLYHDLAGLEPAAPGFARVQIRPVTPDGLDHAEATLDTNRGAVGSSWRRLGKNLVLTVEVPGNTSAQVDVPVAAGGPVPARGGRRDTHYERTDGGYAIYTVNAGRYAFVSSRR